MNFHELTKEIARYEGKKRQVNIGQIKEVTRIALAILAEEFQMSPYEFVLWLGRYQQSARRPWSRKEGKANE